jgi:prophage regulatory protein
VASITVEQARDLADQWQAQRDDFDSQPQADYYRDRSPHQIIEMWETRKGPDGKRLNSWEFGCLIEAWCERFGALPSDAPVANAVALTEDEKPEPLPADDTMLRIGEVVRLTGISVSSIKRMVDDGRFPRPMRIGIRAKGWPARDVRHFIEALNEQRSRPRQ